MQVELVAADRLVWSGEAKMVVARTTEGDVGILPDHAPMLALMVDGIVDVTTTAGETWVAAVDEPNAALIEATRDRADLVVPSAVLEAIGEPPA